MFDLYMALNPLLGIYLLIFSIFTIIIQATNIANNFATFSEKFYEFLILIYLVFLSFILRVVMHSLTSSAMHLHFKYSTYLLCHWLLILVILLASIICLIKKDKQMRFFIVILAVSLSNPFLELLSAKIYSLAFLTSIALLFFRALLLHMKDAKTRNSNITERSISQAMDVQHDGILFYDEKGKILLINKSMLELMKDFSGRYYRNANTFWQEFSKDKEKEGYIYRSNEGKIWQISRTSIEENKKEINQIIAIDITSKEDLRIIIEKTEEIYEEELLSKAWSDIHTILGHRISLLQRYLHNKEDIDLDEIKKQIEDLSIEIPHINQEDYNFEELYLDLKNSFDSLGVNIKREGEFPEEYHLADFYLELIAEGVINAVRHASAKNIFIKLQVNSHTPLIITNDGKEAPLKIDWGGGLSELNRKAEMLDYCIKIKTRPNFTLKLIRKDNEND